MIILGRVLGIISCHPLITGQVGPTSLPLGHRSDIQRRHNNQPYQEGIPEPEQSFDEQSTVLGRQCGGNSKMENPGSMSIQG